MPDSTNHPHQKKNEKYLHLFWEYPPYIQGGLGVAGKALCNALSDYCNIDIVCPETPGAVAEQSYPCAIYQVKMSSFDHLSSTYTSGSHEYEQHTKNQINSFSKGVKAAHFTGYRAIHAHDWITADAAKSIQQANQPDQGNQQSYIPIILHIHSTQVDRVGEQTNGAIFIKEKQAMEDADKVITVSELTKQTIIKYYNIPSDKITVIPNSITKIKKIAHRFSHPPTIIFVARMEQQKSPLFAVEVICAALKKAPLARAIIVGKGSALNVIRDIVKFKKMDSRIEVLGHIPHEKMHLVYQNSDVLILPSTAEPYGLVALEAAQSGAAVILSDRCGASETLRSAPRLPMNTTDSFDSWVNTVVSLLSDEKLRENQVATQLDDLNKYSWNKAARNLLSTLEI